MMVLFMLRMPLNSQQCRTFIIALTNQISTNSIVIEHSPSYHGYQKTLCCLCYSSRSCRYTDAQLYEQKLTGFNMYIYIFCAV